MPVICSFTALISCVADPSWSFDLWALYLASGPYQPAGSTLSLLALSLHGSLIIIIYIYVHMCGTNSTGTLVPTLGSAQSRNGYPIGYRPCTLMGFVVATESVLRPRVFSSPWALAHFLKRGVRLDR